MTPTSRRLYDAIINEKLVLPDLPELAQHAARSDHPFSVGRHRRAESQQQASMR